MASPLEPKKPIPVTCYKIGYRLPEQKFTVREKKVHCFKKREREDMLNRLRDPIFYKGT